MGKHSLVDLGFSFEPVPVGTHVCLFYRDKTHLNQMLLKYIAAGIRNGEKVLCLLDSLQKKRSKPSFARMNSGLKQSWRVPTKDYGNGMRRAKRLGSTITGKGS